MSASEPIGWEAVGREALRAGQNRLVLSVSVVSVCSVETISEAASRLCRQASLTAGKPLAGKRCAQARTDARLTPDTSHLRLPLFNTTLCAPCSPCPPCEISLMRRQADFVGKRAYRQGSRWQESAARKPERTRGSHQTPHTYGFRCSTQLCVLRALRVLRVKSSFASPRFCSCTLTSCHHLSVPEPLK